MGDLKNTVLTKEQVLNDPYGYTYNEILQVLGENTSKSLMADLYRKKAKNAHYTIKVKDYYNGKDTTKYAFEMEDGYCIETVCIKRKTGTTIALVLWLVAQSVVYFVHQEKMDSFEILHHQK